MDRQSSVQATLQERQANTFSIWRMGTMIRYCSAVLRQTLERRLHRQALSRTRLKIGECSSQRQTSVRQRPLGPEISGPSRGDDLPSVRRISLAEPAWRTVQQKDFDRCCLDRRKEVDSRREVDASTDLAQLDAQSPGHGFSCAIDDGRQRSKWMRASEFPPAKAAGRPRKRCHNARAPASRWITP